METQVIYDFIQKTFVYNNEQYNVVLTPELYAEDDGLDFTGNYTGILISLTKGSFPFQLTSGDETKWKMEFIGPSYSAVSEELRLDPEILSEQGYSVADKIIEGINDPGIIDELDRIIQESANGARKSVMNLVK